MDRERYFIFDHLILQEDLSQGEFIDEFTVSIKTGVHGIPVTVHRGGPIGHKRIIRLPALRAKALTIELKTESRNARLRNAAAYYAGNV